MASCSISKAKLVTLRMEDNSYSFVAIYRTREGYHPLLAIYQPNSSYWRVGDGEFYSVVSSLCCSARAGETKSGILGKGNR